MAELRVKKLLRVNTLIYVSEHGLPKPKIMIIKDCKFCLTAQRKDNFMGCSLAAFFFVVVHTVILLYGW